MLAILLPALALAEGPSLPDRAAVGIGAGARVTLDPTLRPEAIVAVQVAPQLTLEPLMRAALLSGNGIAGEEGTRNYQATEASAGLRLRVRMAAPQGNAVGLLIGGGWEAEDNGTYILTSNTFYAEAGLGVSTPLTDRVALQGDLICRGVSYTVSYDRGHDIDDPVIQLRWGLDPAIRMGLLMWLARDPP